MKLNMESRLLISQSSTGFPARGEQPQDKEARVKTAQQFEAIFIRTLFKEMRSTVPDGGLLPKGTAEAIYTDLQDTEAAQNFADQGGIGLAEMMIEQMQGERSDSSEDR